MYCILSTITVNLRKYLLWAQVSPHEHDLQVWNI